MNLKHFWYSLLKNLDVTREATLTANWLTDKNKVTARLEIWKKMNIQESNTNKRGLMKSIERM